MTSIRPTPPPNPPPGLLLGIGIGLAVVGIFGILQHFFDRQKYEQAMHAYRNADCDAAIAKFKRITESRRLFDFNNYEPRAEQKKAECEYFQRAVNQQQQGKFETALANYITLTKTYDDSALVEPAREQVAQMFQTTKMSALATSDVCQQIDQLNQQNLIPQTDVLPQFYLACGSSYEEKKDYNRAITLYQQFLDQHPKIQTQAMKRALAEATVANLNQQGVPNNDAPALIGRTIDGSTVVNIQNSAPRKMLITFSGPTPRFEVLEPCQDCIIYNKESPVECPEKGSSGRYKLEPGQYQVAIEFIEHSDEWIESGVGDWNLRESSEYQRCYVIVRNLDQENRDKNEREQRLSF